LRGEQTVEAQKSFEEQAEPSPRLFFLMQRLREQTPEAQASFAVQADPMPKAA
jgi:hypothetical protein